MHKSKAVLIVSYETQRLYSKLFENHLKNTINSSSHNINKNSSSNSNKQKNRTTTTTTTKCFNDDDGVVVVAADGIHKGDDLTTIINKPNDGDDGDNEELLQFHSNNSVCDLLICDEVR